MKKLIFGYGVTGKSVETYFQKNNIEYLIYDDKPKSGIKSKLFFEYSNIEQIDEVIISPGIKPSNPLLLEIESRGIEVVTDIDIFNKIYSGEIIGITGTNGKTTLVNLLTGYLNLIGKKSIAVGNVGNPPLDIGEQAYDYVVMELSSFQLYYLNNLRLNKAVLMNIFEDHSQGHRYRNSGVSSAARPRPDSIERLHREANPTATASNRSRVAACDHVSARARQPTTTGTRPPECTAPSPSVVSSVPGRSDEGREG